MLLKKIATKVHLVKVVVFPVVMYRFEVGPQRRLGAEELMLSDCVFGQDSWESLGQQGGQTIGTPKGNQPWIFIGKTDGEAEAPIHWPLDTKKLAH